MEGIIECNVVGMLVNELLDAEDEIHEIGIVFIEEEHCRVRIINKEMIEFI